MTVQFVDGSVLFVGSVAMHADCCCGGGETCGRCSGDTPAVMICTFSGVVEGTCGSCTDWNQAHELPQNVSPCNWSGNDPDYTECPESLSENDVVTIPCLGAVMVNLVDTGSNVLCFIDIYQDGVLQASFSETYASVETIDCEDIGSITRGYDSGSRCDWSTATCALSVPLLGGPPLSIIANPIIHGITFFVQPPGTAKKITASPIVSTFSIPVPGTAKFVTASPIVSTFTIPVPGT